MALGIGVSEAQQDVLANGGEVLVIQCLPEPGCYYSYECFHPAYDKNQDPVFVASVMQSYPIDAVCPTQFSRPAHAVTLHDLLSMEQYPHWDYWPSYTGDLVEPCDAFFQDEEGMNVYRIWDGIPVAEIGSAAATSVVRACEQRIGGSAYGVVEELIGYVENEGMICFDEHMGKDDLSDLECEDAEVYLLMKQLVTEGLWEMDFKNHFCWYTGEPLEYKPMEDILAADQDALHAWQRLSAYSQAGTERAARAVPRQRRSSYLREESEFVSWL